MAATGRSEGLVRVLRVAQRLRGGRCTLMDLARDFGVHKRTIRRDCEALRKAGYAVRHHVEDGDNQAGGSWWIER